jgi:cell division protein FtsI/penicillin-binding protein 2
VISGSGHRESRSLHRNKGRDFRREALLAGGVLLALVVLVLWLWNVRETKRVGERFQRMRRLQARCLALLPPEEGTVVVMDPRDGRILALTNPDWAVGMRFPPGSTFKLVAALAALKEQRIDPGWTISCPGYYVFQEETLDCGHVHGEVNFTKGLAFSCNTYFYALGQKVGWKAIADCARACGLSARTGINLPGEVAGEIPQTLSDRQAVDFSVGEGGWVQVTPIGMAVFISAIANGGKRFIPRVIPVQESLRHFRPHPADPLNLPAGFSLILEGMREAVEYGTCVEAKLPHAVAAGKTGTATAVLGGGVTHSWFLGFAPFDRPRYLVVVFNKRGLGQTTSAPLGGQILRACFEEEQR